MREYKIKNRNGDEILFQEVDKNTVKMSGYNKSYCRAASDKEGNTVMFDPSGGLYMAVGMNMTQFIMKDDVPRYITAITHNGSSMLFTHAKTDPTENQRN